MEGYFKERNEVPLRSNDKRGRMEIGQPFHAISYYIDHVVESELN